MRKLMLIVGLVMSAAVARANVITNTVVIVSNIYNNVYSEHIVTQKVQNTHYEYYFTNNVYTVSNVTLLVSKTNQTVYLDVGRSFVIAASNEANRASGSVTDAQGYASQSAGSASAAASSASSASSYANQAASQRSAAASECATALQTINNRIAWFDEHAGETITVVDNSTNVDIHIAQTIITNDFRHVPYDLDPNLEINLNAFAMMAKGGSNNVFNVVAPTSPIGSGGSISVGSFDMTFDHFELVNGKGKFWYRSNYATAEPYGGNGTGWAFAWAYWFDNVWHVAIDQKTYSGGTVSNVETFDMTLTANYTSVSGRMNNRPSVYWINSNNQCGKLTVKSAPSGMGHVAHIALQSQVDLVIAALSNYVARTIETEVAALGARVGSAEATIGEHTTAIGQLDGDVARLDSDVQAVSNRVADIESGSPHPYEHGGTVYSRITVYKTAQDNGKVSADPTSSSSYAAASYKLTPAYRYPTTDVGTWTFVPAYVDTDANGLRLHYVPTEIKAIRYSSSSTRWLVPEYLYWQNGYVYAKIKTYVDGEYDNGYVIGRVQDSNFPNYTTTGKTISRTSYNSWSSSSLGTIVGTSQVTPSGTAVWFAETASPAIVPIISWMLTGK